MRSIVITMPVYNEEQGVGDFILEIHSALSGCKVMFIVVNDCSTDRTVDKITALSQTGIDTVLINNKSNVGHGVSTRTGLEEALNIGADVIVSVDGDGQFLGQDIANIFKLSIEKPNSVIEGVRKNRSDPFYRKVVTNFTRLLVFTRTFRKVKDANTPLRAYSPGSLEKILTKVPREALTPNLFISVVTRAMRFKVIEIEVTSLSRRGQNSEGVTWGPTRKNIPPKKYVLFCLKAIRQWTAIYSTNLKVGAGDSVIEDK